jgi:glycosyltransferase involved in cell wall biosynthesis
MVSIIIPCYNQGSFLPDAIDSLSECRKELFEVIIVNDGSTDRTTLEILAKYESEGYHVVHQDNMGLAHARNSGIEIAKGEYILPLDCDNKVHPEYIYRSSEILDHNENVGVVYSDRDLFGTKSGYDVVGPFNLQRMMLNNYIDACAVFRKSIWKSVGGYDASIKLGVEDWELWLKMAFSGVEFFYIPKALYQYRIREDSLIRTMTREYKMNVKSHLEKKYPDKLGFTIIEDLIASRFRRKPFVFVMKLILRNWFPSVYQRVRYRHVI